MGYSPWGLKESDMAEATQHTCTVGLDTCLINKGDDTCYIYYTCSYITELLPWVPTTVLKVFQN